MVSRPAHTNSNASSADSTSSADPAPLAVASDHAGFALKEQLKTVLASLSLRFEDLGVATTESCDYPDLAHALARGIASGRYRIGVLVCGSGVGMSMAANRHAGVRAAVCTEAYAARLAREHNDANVLCLGARIVGPGLAEEITRAFLAASFEGGRHARRVAKIDAGPGE
jgi:ribose 5-phosphate isomerase B